MNYHGLILAAGSGNRIAKKINTPKCLLEINNRTILEYQIDSFVNADVKKIYIVTGFQSYKIDKFLKKYKRKIEIIIIYNKFFKTTNNMFSAHLAAKYLKNKKFILCNGDVVVEKDTVKKLIEGKNQNEILIDKNFFNEESMKIEIDSFRKIINISKKIKKKKSKSYVSIDFYKLSEHASSKLFEKIQYHIKNIGKNDWTEIALKNILSKCKFYPNEIEGLKWCEIDTYKDLIFAKNKFKHIKKKIFKKYNNFIVDIDGTTFRKQVPIDGTSSFLKNIKKNNKKFFFLSNNSSLNFKSFEKLFKKVNFKINKSNIINSTDVLITYLKDNKIKKVYASGNKKFLGELKKNHIAVSKNNPTVVIVSYDDEINYKKMQTLSELLNKGIKFIATHDDNFYPSIKGPIPDAGSILSLLETTTGKKPSKIFGKPSVEIKKLLKIKGKTIVIGDKIEKDILFAKNCNYDSALVLTEDEIGTNGKIHEKIKPDYILSSIKDLE